MITGHSNHHISHLNGFIYVIAGCDEKNRFTNKCERLNLFTRKWSRIASTNEIRDSIGGVMVPSLNSLFIAGGRVDNACLATTMERYSITSNVWTCLAVELPYGVDMHGIVQIPGRGLRFLLFAGLDEEQNTSNKTCIIDCDSNTTTQIDDMKT